MKNSIIYRYRLSSETRFYYLFALLFVLRETGIRLGLTWESMVPRMTMQHWLRLFVENYWTHQDDPAALFHTLCVSLVSVTLTIRLFQKATDNHTKKSALPSKDVPTCVKRLQWKFLSVFWLLRVAFWMSGPYFYAAYASKTIDGEPVSAKLISQISLAGFCAIALFGPLMGKFSDCCGRKVGTITAALLYGLGALSTTSNSLPVLFLGRAVSGVGTSLLSSAPEAWFVSEFNHHREGDEEKKPDPAWMGDTFGMAYAFDSVVAIFAGQLAGSAAARQGPTGPFQLSPLFLLLGACLAAVMWKENRAIPAALKKRRSSSSKKRKRLSWNASTQEKQQTILDAVKVIFGDAQILWLGGVQSFFEGAMYIFVMTWPPTMSKAIQKAFGESAITPYGTAFSCFMACCMLGSTIFGLLSKDRRVTLEVSSLLLLIISTLALALATLTIQSVEQTGNDDNAHRQLWQLIFAFFVFEACVGVYFPSIGTLRSKFLPDSHRSVIMTLFGVPLNIIVVTVFLSIHKLGNAGAMGVATVSLGLATLSMVGLLPFIQRRRLGKEKAKEAKSMIRRFMLAKQFSEKLSFSIKRTQSERFIEDLARSDDEEVIEIVKERRRSFGSFQEAVF